MHYLTDKKKKMLKKCWLCLVLVLAVALTAALAVNERESKQPEGVAVLSKLGSRGDEVRAIQKKLKSLGFYTGSVDGIYGVGTQSAVKAFQKNCGIGVDGIAGPKTLLYLGLGGSSSSSSKYSNSDVELLAKIISAEARGESYTGQVAVGAVVLNRVSHASFPNTIAGVVYQSGAFDAVTDSNWYADVAASARKAAQDAINGWDPTGGAIYYYNPAKTSNKWMLSRPIVTTIGNHVFCK
ncbi:MAG: spore cortex-lytic enzyme [Oscillospiraceae bacterium]|nr:spore cortex-lytic enzyme [Oscillospiraceae bacterium]